MTVRKCVFWLHLATGVVAGAVILVMSVTGVLLTYQKQMTTWADRSLYPVESLKGSGPLPIERLVTGTPGAVAVTVYSEPTAPALVSAGGRSLFVDPYSGAVLGEGSTAIRSFFRSVTEWHRWLSLSGPKRNSGRAITGACNLAFLFIVGSGLWLWFPRQWTVASIRQVIWFREGLRGKARDFNWHNVLGFWSCVPLFLVVLGGVIISYPWASNMVYRVTGNEAPAPGPQPLAAAPARPLVVNVEGVDALLLKAKTQVTDWRSINVRLPADALAPVTVAIDRGNGGQPQLRSTLVLDRTGSVVRWERFEDQNAGRQLRTWFRFVHTGEFYGVAGQTIAGLASVSGVLLVWTGIALALRRLRTVFR